ncbi:hypothetical protein G7047_07325 [Diaphorobacter sp. HDW4A]|uniref:hypothetical protein n=1 Tax=Diaphorobacter sp. HDW4A TaxID=2714924 RepID=UPI00140C31F6|nr:hypothetical protein [Diaphorobacter sp. HDW4A]QIL79734.1 hypothetical protein G7047_07325 [Diaphorobacter sp. HDW4A]
MRRNEARGCNANTCKEAQEKGWEAWKFSAPPDRRFGQQGIHTPQRTREKSLMQNRDSV